MSLDTIKQRLLKLDTCQICDASEGDIRLMRSDIRPLCSITRMVGTAFTVMSADNIMTVLETLEQSQENDVLVIDCNNSPYAFAGELFANEAKRKKLAGFVIDGYCRDLEGIKASGTPVFAKGICAKKSHSQTIGKVQVPITCGDVLINPNDVIFADENGIVVLSHKEIPAIIEKAEHIKKEEECILEQINSGVSLNQLIKKS